MLELLIEFLGDGLIELILQLTFELILGRADTSVRKRQRRPRPQSPLVVGVLPALCGLCTGLLTVWLLPPPVFGSVPLGAAGLLVSPPVAGAAMFLYGRWRLRFGPRPAVATFWGGFVFAAAVSLVRGAALWGG